MALTTTSTSSSEPSVGVGRWPARFGWFARAAIEMVYPPSCVICQEPLNETNQTTAAAPFCVACRDQLLSSPASLRCHRCGSNVSREELDETRCIDCRALTLHFSTVLPLGDYRDDLRDSVLRMKKASHRVLSRSMASLLWEERCGEIEKFKPDLITAIPMHWSQRLWQGMNSAEEVAESLARHLRVPYGPRLLIRRRNTEPQSRLSRTRRFENVRNAFRISKCYVLHQTRILLVDDILTTGATCSEAARMLKGAGAAEVGVTVVAKSIRPGAG